MLSLLNSLTFINFMGKKKELNEFGQYLEVAWITLHDYWALTNRFIKNHKEYQKQKQKIITINIKWLKNDQLGQ